MCEVVDYMFELSNGEHVFVEVEKGSKIDEVKAYLQNQLSDDIKVDSFLDVYSVEDAEMIGYDTY